MFARVMIAALLGGLFVSIAGTAQAQSMSEFARVLPIVQTVDIDGDGSLDRVEGGLQIDDSGNVTGSIVWTGTESEGRLTFLSGYAYCRQEVPVVEMEGTLELRRDGGIESFEVKTSASRNRHDLYTTWQVGYSDNLLHANSWKPQNFELAVEWSVDPCVTPLAIAQAATTQSGPPLITDSETVVFLPMVAGKSADQGTATSGQDDTPHADDTGVMASPK